MKRIVFVVLSVFLLYSCVKDAVKSPSGSVYLNSVVAHLRDSLPKADFDKLDTSQAFLTDPGQSNSYVLRLPFRGRSVAEEFVLLRTDAMGSILQGRVVHLAKDSSVKTPQFSGNISLRALSGTEVVQSTIVNGFMVTGHGSAPAGIQVNSIQRKGVTDLIPADDNSDWLDEVVVVGYYPDGGSDGYISLDQLLGPSTLAPSGGVTGGGGDASSSGGGGGATAGGSGGAAGGNNSTNPFFQSGPRLSPLNPARPLPGRPASGPVFASPAMETEQEYINFIATVDVRKLFNCFDQVPSAGAIYTVQLCVDVPVNNNPTASLNTSGISAGHTFLVVTKSGSGVSITQSFGYYPSTAPSLWNPFSAIPSAIKNNSSQEINGSLSMSITGDQFNTLRNNAISRSSAPYTLDSSNCTDYALGVFNSARSTPLVLEPFNVNQPSVIMSGAPASPGYTFTIVNSPQQLYEKLSQMKTGGSAEASNIQLDLSHNTKAPVSHGECN